MSVDWNGTTLLRGVVAPAMLGLLAACSDGGGGDPLDPPPTFAELTAEGLTLTDEIETLEDATFEDLPTSGTARYEGVMLIETEEEVALAGEMEMNVAFGDSSDPISGGVSNIVDMDDRRYAGTLDISDSFIDPDANPDLGSIAGAGLSGTLTDPDDQAFAIEADLEIGFGGTADDAVSHAGGFVDGDACSGGECLEFDGAFILTR